MITKKYEYIIIGSGPSSLTIAYHLSKLKKKCLLMTQKKESKLLRIAKLSENFTLVFLI